MLGLVTSDHPGDAVRGLGPASPWVMLQALAYACAVETNKAARSADRDQQWRSPRARRSRP